MKSKWIACILCLALLLPCFSTAAAADTLYIVTETIGAKVYAYPDENAPLLTTVKVNTVFSSDKSDGNFLHVVYDGFSGWIDAGDTALYGVSLRLSRIEVTKLPDKTHYYEDEPFLADGMVVTAYYTNGTSAPISGYSIMVPDMYSLGSKTVTVTYQGQTASFSIEVARIPISHIEISSMPASLQVIEDTDEPRFEGLELTVYYTDGRAPSTTTDYMLLGYEPLLLGRQTVQLCYKYEDITVPLTIEVVLKTLIDLQVSTPPTKQIYYNDDMNIDLSGLVLTAFYDNGKSETVQPESAAFAPSYVLNSDAEIELTYGGRKASYTVRLNRAEPVGISVTPPLTTDCFLNETPDLGGLVVYLEYNSGRREGIDDYTIDPIDTSSFGTKTVNVYYESYSASFEIHVVSDGIRGDVNKDGKISSSDARSALRFAVSLETLSEEQQWLADMNADGTVTTADARRILRAAVGLDWES